MSKNQLLAPGTYYSVSAVLFTFAFLVHGTRALNGWDLFLGSWLVPMWVSYLVVVVAAVLAYQSMQMRK